MQIKSIYNIVGELTMIADRRSKAESCCKKKTDTSDHHSSPFIINHHRLQFLTPKAHHIPPYRWAAAPILRIF